MDKEDRERLIKMETKLEMHFEHNENHIKESREFRQKIYAKMEDHSNRLTALETRNKVRNRTGLGKFLSAIIMFFKG